MADTEISLLEGRVLKRSLPVVQGAPGPDAPKLKRLMLRQGELAHFWDGEEEIRYLAYLELRQGAVRGNHYHLVRKELVYVISGEVLLTVEEIASKRRESVALGIGDLGIIDTRIAHAYQTIVPGQAIEFSEARFDPADVYSYQML